MTHDMELEGLGLEESILKVLLVNAQFNDSNRCFAGLRRPSKCCREVMQMLVHLHEKRTVIFKSMKKAG